MMIALMLVNLQIFILVMCSVLAAQNLVIFYIICLYTITGDIQCLSISKNQSERKFYPAFKANIRFH